jgi:hypothetical protein
METRKNKGIPWVPPNDKRLRRWWLDCRFQRRVPTPIAHEEGCPPLSHSSGTAFAEKNQTHDTAQMRIWNNLGHSLFPSCHVSSWKKIVQHPKLRLFAVESVERPRSSPMPLQVVVVVHTLGRCRKQKPRCVSQTVLHRWLRMKSLKFRTNTNRYSNKLDVDFRKCCAVGEHSLVHLWFASLVHLRKWGLCLAEWRGFTSRYCWARDLAVVRFQVIHNRGKCCWENLNLKVGNLGITCWILGMLVVRSARSFDLWDKDRKHFKIGAALPSSPANESWKRCNDNALGWNEFPTISRFDNGEKIRHTKKN